MTREEEVRAIKRRHSAELLSRPGVCGVGVEKDERGEFVLVVHLESDDPQLRDAMPTQLDGCTVRLIASGPFRKL